MTNQKKAPDAGIQLLSDQELEGAQGGGVIFIAAGGIKAPEDQRPQRPSPQVSERA